MKELNFRALNPDEIDVRISEVSKSGNGLSLLLYKNARCDMSILDETATPLGWQREHYECKGNLFCRVGIKGDDGWVWKSDAGKESNYEAEKGEASDSFKRACFNWGIGRELYTAPRIWISNDKCNIKENSRGGYACYDTFSVVKVVIENHQLKAIAIRNDKTKKNVFIWQSEDFKKQPKLPSTRKNNPLLKEVSELRKQCVSIGIKDKGLSSWEVSRFQTANSLNWTNDQLTEAKNYYTQLIRDKEELG